VDWLTALAGEVGEVMNVLKKLNRVRDDIPNNESKEQLLTMLADELADSYCYADLFRQALGKSFDVPSRLGYHDGLRIISRATQANVPADAVVPRLLRALGRLAACVEDCDQAASAAQLIDVAAYVALLAHRYGVNLEDAVHSKFDRVSVKIGYVPPTNA
jgi:NTP pyrophosphatase (non-canonical NTP hydrolase)